MTGETPPLLFSAMAKKKEQTNKKPPKQKPGTVPKFNNRKEAEAYIKKNYGSAKTRREKKTGLGKQSTSKGFLAKALGVDTKSGIQDLASKDYKKDIKKRIEESASGILKETTRKYATAPITKLLTKAMGGGAMAGIVSRQVSRVLAPELRAGLTRGILAFNNKLGNPLDKLHNKATDFAAKIADTSRQGVLSYGEKAGFIPKGSKERYNDPAKQAHYQAQQERKAIRDATINKDGKHAGTLNEYRNKIKEAKASGNTKEYQRLLKESKSYRKSTKKEMLKSGLRRKSDERFKVQHNKSGFNVISSPGKGYASRSLANMAGALRVGRKR